MAYVNLYVGNDANINVKNNQIYITNSVKQDFFPLEDVNSIIVENLKINISAYTLSKLVESGALVYFCDEKHTPIAYLLPFYSHFNQIKIYKFQSELSAPLRKQLWKDIVVHKIQNQNDCLKLCGKEGILQIHINQVKSGDSGNTEAVAASKYFKNLFYQKFTREQENNINSALNYGYAILRGAVARSLVSHGLLPFLGLNHHSVLNNYNLADDLIEVFRPFVDLCVFENFDVYFDTKYKKLLYGLLNCDCIISNSKYALSYAIEIFVQSFVDSLLHSTNNLKFPKLIKLSKHEYM